MPSTGLPIVNPLLRRLAPRPRSLCVAVLALAAGAAHAKYKVDIDAPREVRGLLKDFLDLSRYKDRDDLSPEQFNFLVTTAPDQVKKLVATQGYFSPKTTVRVEGKGKGDERVVHIAVEPHERTTVSNVTIGATGAVTTEDPARLETIRKNWALPAGRPFTQKDWNTAKDRGLQTLRERRYAAAKVGASEARVVPEQHDAQLSVEYDSGPPFTLGELRITGDHRYPEQIVRNVNPLAVGEPYSTDRLLALQRAIQNTPYYANAVVSIDSDPAHADEAPVNVRLTEYPTQRLRTGVGYATDTGAQIQGRYSNYDVFGKAYAFDSQIRLEQRRQYGYLELAMPPSPGAWVNSVNGSAERTTLEGIDLRSLRAGLKRARTREKIDIAYAVDYYRDELTQLNGAALPPNTFVTPGVHQALVPSVTWTRRDVDDPTFPRRGNIITAQAGGAVKGLVTDQTFLRFYGRIKQFFPVAERDSVILRGEAGSVITKGGNTNVPASLLFRAGGNESVRGYSYQSIGNEQNGTVYPTKYLVVGSAEYDHWFTRDWGGAVFYDVGTAANSFADRQLYQGVGFGVRYRSPVGPINVDLGYGIERHQIRPHFSLGFAF